LAFTLARYPSILSDVRPQTVFFKGKELALAFGITLTASRAGSVLNFFISPWLDNVMGYRFVFWLGTGLCGLSFLASLLYLFLEKNAEKYGRLTCLLARSFARAPCVCILASTAHQLRSSFLISP